MGFCVPITTISYQPREMHCPASPPGWEGVWVWMGSWVRTTHGFIALFLLRSLLCNTLAVPTGAGCPAVPGGGYAKHEHLHVFCREDTQLSTP